MSIHCNMLPCYMKMGEYLFTLNKKHTVRNTPIHQGQQYLNKKSTSWSVKKVFMPLPGVNLQILNCMILQCGSEQCLNTLNRIKHLTDVDLPYNTPLHTACHQTPIHIIIRAAAQLKN